MAETDLLLWVGWTEAWVIPLSPAAGFLIGLARTIAIISDRRKGVNEFAPEGVEAQADE